MSTAAYPSTLRTFTDKVDEVDIVMASHVNLLQAEMEAVQAELGTNPSGPQPTVASFLSNLNSVKYQEGNTLKASGGSAANPGQGFADEAGLGVFRAGAGILGVAAGGVEQIRATASGVSATNMSVTGSLTVSGSTSGIDHGALAGRGDDDHTAYPLVTGARGFSGPVPGALPTSGAHLTTKTYVDDRLPAGTIATTARSTAPAGWLVCDGSAVSRTTYAALFAAIDVAFGAGDGSTTFNLPDIRDRFIVGAGGAYTRNEKGGAASVSLTEANLASHNHSGPSHTHTVDPPVTSTSSDSHVHAASTSGDGNHVHDIAGTANEGASGTTNWDVSGHVKNKTIRQTATQGLHTHTVNVGSDSHGHTVNTGAFNSAAAGTGNTGSAGSGSAHENRPPYIGLLVIIRT